MLICEVTGCEIGNPKASVAAGDLAACAVVDIILGPPKLLESFLMSPGGGANRPLPGGGARSPLVAPPEPGGGDRNPSPTFFSFLTP